MSKKIFVNFTMPNSDAVAILVLDGKIEKIFHSGASLPEQECVDLKGGVLYPGFIDTHTHFLHSALTLSDISLREVQNLEQLSDLLISCQGERIRGAGLDDTLWQVKPNRLLLDRISSRPIAIFKRDYHTAIANSSTIEQLSIPARFSQERQSGIFSGEAFLWLSEQLLSNCGDDLRMESLERVSKVATAAGITAIHALEGGKGWGMGEIDFLSSLKSWAPRIFLYPQIFDFDYAENLGLKRIGGCLLVDGSFGSHTAALNSPYLDAPNQTGELYLSQKALENLISKAQKRGFQIAFHAIGDRAVATLSKAYAKILHGENPNRDRIEHAMLIDPESLDRIVKNNLLVATQPAFLSAWGGEDGVYQRRLGKARADALSPLATFNKLGVPLAGGSDFDVTPLAPLAGIQAAVTHPNRSERLSVEEAIALFTSSAAFFSFSEDSLGRIEEGYAADFTILKEQIETTPTEKISEIEVLCTVVAGEILFSI